MLVPSQRPSWTGCESISPPRTGPPGQYLGCLRLELPSVPGRLTSQRVPRSGLRGLGRGPARARRWWLVRAPQAPEAAAVMTSWLSNGPGARRQGRGSYLAGCKRTCERTRQTGPCRRSFWKLFSSLAKTPQNAYRSPPSPCNMLSPRSLLSQGISREWSAPKPPLGGFSGFRGK